MRSYKLNFREVCLCIESPLVFSFLTGPRSMFPNGVVPEPRRCRNVELRNLEPLPLELPFINQEKQFLFAWRTLISNQAESTPTLSQLVANQMNGSGKTTFGQNLLNWENPKILQLFETRLNDCDQTCKDNLKNALPVYVDLQSVRRKRDNETLDNYVSWLIILHTFQQHYDLKPEEIAEYWSRSTDAMRSPHSCIEMLQDLLGRRLFVHFDEMGQLPLKLKVPCESRGDEMDLIYEFWTEAHNIQRAGSFLFLSGTFILDGMRGRTSCKVAHLRLSLFQEEDIRELLWNSNSQSPSQIGDALLLRNPDSAVTVAKRLSQLTTGVPRFVTSLLVHMITETKERGLQIDWETYPENILLDFLNQVPATKPTLQSNPELTSLFYRAAYGLPCKNNRTLFNCRWLHVSDVASYYGVYVNPFNSEFYKLVLPYVWLHKVALPIPFWEILKSEAAASLLHKSFRIERAIEGTLLIKTNIPSEIPCEMTVSRVFDFLDGSIVGDEEIVSADVSLQLMEKRLTATNEEVVLREAIDTLPDGCVHVRASPLSRMPDVLTVLPRSSPEISRSIIGWEMKNYSKSKFTVGQLQEAADKFGDLLRDAGDASGVLVIFLNGQCCDDLEPFRGHLVTEASGIPGLKLNNEKMEVIVLSTTQVAQFFGISSFFENFSVE
jgi:hypothetical protein